MRPVSSKFLESLRGSHTMAAEAYVVSAGQTGVSPTGTFIPIIEGDIESDSTAAIRSTLELVTDGTDMFPDSASDLFAPYGNEIFVRRGIRFGGGAVEWVSLGYYRINAVEQDEAPNGVIRISAQDRMAGIVEARLLAPVQFSATATYGDVIEDLVTEVYPWATIQWDDPTFGDAIGRSVIAEEDRFAFLDDLITSVGKIWYWNHRGVLTIKNTPTSDDPVWEVNAGENGVLVALAKDLSREGVYNAVVASGEALDTEAPPRAVAVDDNPDSPTYWDGDFGKVPRFYSSPFLTTDAQAQSAANSLLRQKLGLPYSVDFSVVPNPALEPWDPVSVRTEGVEDFEPAALVADTFNRTVVDGWGTASSGEAWTATAVWDVTPGYGTNAITTPNQSSHAVLNGVIAPDVDGYMVVSVPNMATGAALITGAATHYSNPGSISSYQLRLEFNVAGTVTAKISRIVSGSFLELASNNPVPGLTYTAGQLWKLRFRQIGSLLRMKIWPNDSNEPNDWTLETTDASNATGAIGVWAWKQTANSNTGVLFQVHEFVVNTYERPAGDIHVIERMTIPLTADQAMTADTREQTLVVIGEGV